MLDERALKGEHPNDQRHGWTAAAAGAKTLRRGPAVGLPPLCLPEALENGESNESVNLDPKRRVLNS